MSLPIIVRHQLVHYGLALSLSMAAVCFLLAMLAGKTGGTARPAPARQSFAVGRSPQRISAALVRSLAALGWEKQQVTVTGSSATLEALTSKGIPVKISVIPASGQAVRVHIETEAPGPINAQLTQQLRDALLLALR